MYRNINGLLARHVFSTPTRDQLATTYKHTYGYYVHAHNRQTYIYTYRRMLATPIDGLWTQFCVSSSVHTTNVIAQLQLACHEGYSFVWGELLLSASFCEKNLEKGNVGGVGKC